MVSVAALLAALPHGALILDAAGRVTLANEAAGRYFGRQAEALRGHDPARLLPGVNWEAAPLENGWTLVLLRPEWQSQAEAPTFDRLCGSSGAMAEVRRMGALAARSSATVLLLGESGTGKELLAKAIHRASARAQGPFVAVNCAAVPDGLLEAEFFGYEEGAFTGARRGGKPGRFELAQGGTIFLDEVGELAPPLQAKLLRVLQEREVERVGSTRTVALDVRVIAASNRDLESMVQAGAFRADLYYRLNVLSLTLPPLRDRIEDLPELVDWLLRKFAHAPLKVSGEAMALLAGYRWPGNVRELENVLERAVALHPGTEIKPEHLPPALAQRLPGAAPWRLRRQEAERHMLLGALEQAGGNKAAAARLLGISRSRLYEKLSQLGQA